MIVVGWKSACNRSCCLSSRSDLHKRRLSTDCVNELKRRRARCVCKFSFQILKQNASKIFDNLKWTRNRSCCARSPLAFCFKQSGSTAPRQFSINIFCQKMCASIVRSHVISAAAATAAAAAATTAAAAAAAAVVVVVVVVDINDRRSARGLVSCAHMARFVRDARARSPSDSQQSERLGEQRATTTRRRRRRFSGARARKCFLTERRFCALQRASNAACAQSPAPIVVCNSKIRPFSSACATAIDLCGGSVAAAAATAAVASLVRSPENKEQSKRRAFCAPIFLGCNCIFARFGRDGEHAIVTFGFNVTDDHFESKILAKKAGKKIMRQRDLKLSTWRLQSLHKLAICHAQNKALTDKKNNQSSF